MPLVLGIDSSTQACKVEVRDADTGRLIASGRAPHPEARPPRSEQETNAWWDALVAAVRQAGVHDVAAIAVAAQQHGMVVLDEGHDVIRPAKLWNDTESAQEAQRIVQTLGAAQLAEACGSLPVAAFTITKLAWLKTNEPEHYARVARVLLPHDWLTYRLTDNVVTDRGDASGTGYWSPVEERWRPDLLASLVEDGVDWGARLPDVLEPTAVAGVLTREAADELGLPAGRPVAPGTGDNMAAALGVGLRRGDVVFSLGTSGTVYAVSEQPTRDPTGAVAGFADATGRFLPLVCTLNATKVTETVAAVLGVDLVEFDQLALRARAGAGGLVLLPYFDGERTPNRPDATGVLAGLRSDVKREDLARASVEGVVCGLLDGLDALESVGVDVDTGRVILVGGGARSSAFRRVLPDLLQRPVLVPGDREHVAAGACVQAAAIVQGCRPEDIFAWWKDEGDVVEPHPHVNATEIRASYSSLRDRA